MDTRSITHGLNFAGSLLTTALRSGMGAATQPLQDRPNLLLELYDFEACPYCRLVREALTELDIDALVYPCPKGGTRFRPRVRELGGRTQFPFLVDPNNGVQLYESADIVRYLFQTYGRRPPPLYWQWMELQQLGSALAGAARLGAGLRAAPSAGSGPATRALYFRGQPVRAPGT